jgi:hypothetical protein
MSKGIDKRLDDAWSEAVKVLAGHKCEYCGKETHLNSHHVYSRSNRSTRWDVVNGYCLCVSHHVFGNFSAHKSPTEFTLWMIEDRGRDWLDKLQFQAHQMVKYSKDDKEEILVSLWNIINKV